MAKMSALAHWMLIFISLAPASLRASICDGSSMYGSTPMAIFGYASRTAATVSASSSTVWETLPTTPLVTATAWNLCSAIDSSMSSTILSGVRFLSSSGPISGELQNAQWNAQRGVRLKNAWLGQWRMTGRKATSSATTRSPL